MDSFNSIVQIQQIMLFIVPILMVVSIGFMIIMMFSSKFRGKLMRQQLKDVKHMTDYLKNDMEDYSKNNMADILENLGSIAINSKNNIINQNEDILKNISNKEAEINKDAIRTVTAAIKDGWDNNDTMFCKHCGAMIDADSKFCKSCGKEQ